MNTILKNRDILTKISKFLDDRQSIILIGPRQTGKTTLLSLIKNQYPAKHQILLLNAEKDTDFLHLTDFSSFTNYLKANINSNKKTLIFIDEFQKINQPTKLLKLIYDELENIKIICTGSSSLEIFSSLSEESLTGRKHVINIFPLTFSEFLNFRYPENFSSFNQQVKDKNLINLMPEIYKPWEDFIIWGGYPRSALINNTELRHEELKEIYNSYLQKDIAEILNKGDRTSFMQLLILLSAQNGRLLNINELSNTLKLERYKIEKFIFLLEETFVIKTLKPYFTNKRKEITKMPKFYFIDTGLRNSIKNDFSEINLRSDNGELVENFVFMELLKNSKSWHEFYFWRTPQGTETDFIIKYNELLFPIEVKYKNFKKAIVPTGLKAFINIYKPKQAFVLTKNFSEVTNYNNTKVFFLPIPLTIKIFKHLSYV